VPEGEQGLYLDRLLAAELSPQAPPAGSAIRAGLDLGTHSIVLAVLDGSGAPLALAREQCFVVRDGLVVDFSGARAVCHRLRQKLEAALGVSLHRAAIAVPPGTGERDSATHRYVCEAAGLEADAVFDEPVAANFFLGIRDGAIADLGGGTTGAAVLEGGRLVLSFDEPTGGHHLSLVLAGRLKIPLERAEAVKLDPARRAEVAPAVAPVLSKMGRILKEGFQGRAIPLLYLVGGSAAAPGAGAIIARETGIPTRVLREPELITPVGIALGCRPYPARPPEA
jgi:ethanolamine utilization protein EutJ